MAPDRLQNRVQIQHPGVLQDLVDLLAGAHDVHQRIVTLQHDQSADAALGELRRGVRYLVDDVLLSLDAVTNRELARYVNDSPSTAPMNVLVSPAGDRVVVGIDAGDHGEVRILNAGTLALELRRRGGRYGLATMCVGVGQGVAMAIEMMN